MDESLEKIILSKDIFEIVFKLLQENESKNNMLFSIILDILNIITKENLKNIISFIVS